MMIFKYVSDEKHIKSDNWHLKKNDKVIKQRVEDNKPAKQSYNKRAVGSVLTEMIQTLRSGANDKKIVLHELEWRCIAISVFLSGW